jgi:hypothetical protein
MGESTDDCLLLVDIGADRVEGNISGAQTEPANKSTINVQAGEVSKTFDACSCRVLEFVNSVATDGWAVG